MNGRSRNRLMKSILRDLRIGLYFQGGASWIKHAEEALRS
jgi:hypothetical protein